jgi:hypothetical protein
MMPLKERMDDKKIWRTTGTGKYDALLAAAKSSI